MLNGIQKLSSATGKIGEWAGKLTTAKSSEKSDFEFSRPSPKKSMRHNEINRAKAEPQSTEDNSVNETFDAISLDDTKKSEEAPKTGFPFSRPSLKKPVSVSNENADEAETVTADASPLDVSIEDSIADAIADEATIEAPVDAVSAEQDDDDVAQELDADAKDFTEFTSRRDKQAVLENWDAECETNPIDDFNELFAAETQGPLTPFTPPLLVGFDPKYDYVELEYMALTDPETGESVAPKVTVEPSEDGKSGNIYLNGKLTAVIAGAPGLRIEDVELVRVDAKPSCEADTAA
jgi:hypothetical protein